MAINPGSSALKDGKIPAMDTALDSANPVFPKRVHALQWGLLDAAADDSGEKKLHGSPASEVHKDFDQHIAAISRASAEKRPFSTQMRVLSNKRQTYNPENLPSQDAAADGGDGSGVPERHNVENLPDIKSNLGNVAEDKKRFTEGLHNRRANGTFEPSSERGLTRRKKQEEEEFAGPDEEDLLRR